MSSEEEILDYRNNPEKGIPLTPFYGVAFLLFIYWFGAGYFQLPFTWYALLLGMVLLFIAAVIRFRRVVNKTYTDYAYLVGRSSLIVGVFLHLSGWPYSQWFMWGAFAFFGAGLLNLILTNRSQR